MQKMMTRMLITLTVSLMLTGPAFGGGVDPRDLPQTPPVKREQVTAAPEETATAVRRARQAVAPPPAAVVPVAPAVPMMTTPAPRRSAPASVPSGDGWFLAIPSGGCEPLENVRRQGVDVGPFASPQELGRKLQQRGHQAFVLDIGDAPDRVVRVRVPDLQADFEFRRAGQCR